MHSGFKYKYTIFSVDLKPNDNTANAKQNEDLGKKISDTSGKIYNIVDLVFTVLLTAICVWYSG